MRRAAGFTLVELVVAITISSVVMIFAVQFMQAPIDAQEVHERRTALAVAAADAWPRMEADLRAALPNSVRVRRNGGFVALELLAVSGMARYKTPPGATFDIAGTDGNEFRGITLPFASNSVYLSINNLGTGGQDAYSLPGPMTAGGSSIQITDTAVPGQATITINPAPLFAGDSPRHTVYLVSGPVTWLCDEGQAVLRRYTGYAVAGNQASWDTPGEFAAAGINGPVIARGVTGCNFAVSAVGAPQSQTVSVRLTSTNALSGESVMLLHSMRAEYVP